ncbi:MAG TPA: hypothetical protein VHO24_21125 [Opitutaceae bacterium]|nr:hypothetical protein [Opitutaceae bacterium]
MNKAAKKKIRAEKDEAGVPLLSYVAVGACGVGLIFFLFFWRALGLGYPTSKLVFLASGSLLIPAGGLLGGFLLWKNSEPKGKKYAVAGIVCSLLLIAAAAHLLLNLG